jgi:peptide/nickel transport system substrate-binding protein
VRDAAQLVVATDAPVRSLDPRLAVDNASAKVSRLVFEGLTEVDKHGMPQLVLAERITPGVRTSASGEPLQYIAKIRRGVKFHDGRPLTGHDVAYTYQSVMDPAFKAIIAGAFRRRFRSVTVARDDPYSVIFELRRPLATFLTDVVLGIAPASLARQSRQRFVGQPVGTGPWRIAVNSTNERVVLRRFEGHRGHAALTAGKPNSLVFASIVDEGSRALSILGGGADLAIGGISPAVLDSAASGGRGVVEQAPGIAWAYVGLNLRLSKFADLRVRRAIAMAIDRQGIVDGLLGGRARIAEGMIAPEHWAHVALPPTAHDPAMSRRLLDEAGFVRDSKNPGKSRFSLTLKVSTNRLRRSIGAAVARDLATVGIDATVRSFEIGTFLADVRAGRFDAFLLILPEPLEPDFLAWMFHSQNAPQKHADASSKSPYARLDRRALMPGVFSAEVSADPDCAAWSKTAVGEGLTAFALAPLGLAESFGSANRTSYHDPITSCLLELGRATSERPERKRLYGRAQLRIADAVPVVPLWFEDQVALVRKGVKIPPLVMDGRFGVLRDATLPNAKLRDPNLPTDADQKL